MFYYFFQHKIIWTELNSIPWGEKAGCDLVLKTLHKKKRHCSLEAQIGELFDLPLYFDQDDVM